jgi:hypothetical protein
MLTPRQLKIAERTISSNAFHAIVMHYAEKREGLSVVRMADGEAHIMELAKLRNPDAPAQVFNPRWRAKMGLEGITFGQLTQRMQEAVSRCTYFAPSVSGLTMPEYDVTQFFDHPRLVDNFFTHQWSDEQKAAVCDACETITLINSNPGIADALQARFGSRCEFLPMNNWRAAYEVALKATTMPGRLVLLSGGPAGKFLAPAIAEAGKIVLDVGHSAETWTGKWRKQSRV